MLEEEGWRGECRESRVGVGGRGDEQKLRLGAWEAGRYVSGDVLAGDPRDREVFVGYVFIFFWTG